MAAAVIVFEPSAAGGDLTSRGDPEPFGSDGIRTGLYLGFDAFSSCEPVSTSLENAAGGQNDPLA